MAIDLDNITADQWKEGMGEVKPGEAVTTTQAPTPTQNENVNRGTNARQDANTAPQADGRPRNPDGTFAPRTAAEQQQDAAPAKPVPFEGFDKLDPAIQAQYNRLLGERDDFRMRYLRANGENTRLKRSVSPGSGREAQSVVPSRSGANTQVGQAADQARQGAQNLQPQQRAEVNRQIDAWQAHAQQYPDDAKAIEQRLGLLHDEIANKLASGIAGPLMQELQNLRQQIGEVRGSYEAIESERAEQRAAESQHVLDEVAGDNWRQIAGWEDENGNPVQGEPQWHPEFQAWVNGHDPDVASEMWERLSHKSPRVVGQIIRQFNAETFALDHGGAPTPPTDPRMANLRDVAPNARGNAIAPPGQNQPKGGSYDDLFRINDHAEWKRRMA